MLHLGASDKFKIPAVIYKSVTCIHETTDIVKSVTVTYSLIHIAYPVFGRLHNTGTRAIGQGLFNQKLSFDRGQEVRNPSCLPNLDNGVANGEIKSQNRRFSQLFVQFVRIFLISIDFFFREKC